MVDANNRLMVVSGHAADFVWRAGGAISHYVKQGAAVYLIVLSYGVRGESNDLWKMEGQTVENVKKIRHEEAMHALDCLGVKEVEFWDYQDYYMDINDERLEQLARKIRQFKPQHIITHSPRDPFNPDHETVAKFVHRASVLAISNGVKIAELPAIPQMKIFGFEPHQSEISDFKPDVIIDITNTYPQKRAAMDCFKAQKHLIDYYDMKTKMRGNHARRISGNASYQHAEAFSRLYPYVGNEFI